MPPKTANEHPEFLRPYFFHKLEISYSGTADANGTCPFCYKENKFFVSQKTGQHQCKVCGVSGNAYTFLRTLYKLCKADQAELEIIAEERRVGVEMLKRWGLVQSIVDREWMLPTTGDKGEINNLYRWVRMKQKDGHYKRRLLTTATMSHGLFGSHLWDDKKPDAYLCEGPWDGMAFEEALMKYRRDGERLVRTVDLSRSLSAVSNVVAVPGCETFRDAWSPRFAGKRVFLMFDNDHPRTHPTTGALLTPAGHAGMKSAAKKLRAVAKEVHAIHWGEGGFDPSLPDGFDVRDFLHATE